MLQEFLFHKFKGNLQPTDLTVVSVLDEKFTLWSQWGVAVVVCPLDLQTDQLLEDLFGVNMKNGPSV